MTRPASVPPTLAPATAPAPKTLQEARDDFTAEGAPAPAKPVPEPLPAADPHARAAPDPSAAAPGPTLRAIMSTDVRVVAPEVSLREAAQMMLALDVGALPVCTGTRLLGMVTDRDIAIRGVAAGLSPDTARVADVMTPELKFCTEDQEIDEALQTMGEAQVRRLPVVNGRRELVGIVSLGDIARRQPAPVDQTLRDISAPGR